MKGTVCDCYQWKPQNLNLRYTLFVFPRHFFPESSRCQTINFLTTITSYKLPYKHCIWGFFNPVVRALGYHCCPRRMIMLRVFKAMIGG